MARYCVGDVRGNVEIGRQALEAVGRRDRPACSRSTMRTSKFYLPASGRSLASAIPALPWAFYLKTFDLFGGLSKA
jgi:hypothetical protein